MTRWMTRAATALMVLSATLPAAACLHGPASFTGKLGAENYVALVLHDGERETLILNVQLDVEGPPDKDGKRVPIDDALEGLGHVGWVIALPATPDLYSADVKPEIFAEVEKLVPKSPEDESGVLTFGGGDGPESIEVRLVRAGPYLIHEVKAKGAGAVDGLNAWFAKNGYATKKRSEMGFFVERGYTFLCVRVDPAKAPKPKPAAKPKTRPEAKPKPAKDSGKTRKKPLSFGFDDENEEPESPSGLPPLLVSFAAKRPFIPLKFSSHQGVFSLQALTLTKAPIDWKASAPVLKQMGVESLDELWFPACSNTRIKPAAFKGELARVLGMLREKKRLGEPSTWYLNNLVVDEINLDDRPISGWKSDVWLELDQDPKGETIRTALEAVLRPWSELDAPARGGFKAVQELGPAALPTLSRELLTCPGFASRRRYLLLRLITEVLSGELTKEQQAEAVRQMAVCDERTMASAAGTEVELAIVDLRLGRPDAVEQAIRAMESAFHGSIENHEAGIPGATPESRFRRVIAALEARVEGAPAAPPAKGSAVDQARAHLAAWQAFAESLDGTPVFDPGTGRYRVQKDEPKPGK